MDPLETRELRYFLAVAEELHFGRAAERIGIAQPPLSRAVRQLERRLGVTLFDRSTRHVALTAAGAALVDDARAVLERIEAAARRARRAGALPPSLVVAVKADDDGGLLPRVLKAYEEDPDALPAELRFGGWGEQTAMLRDGRADVALMHAPFDRRGLDAEPVLTEPRLLAVAADHRLAARERLTMADVAGEPLPRWEGEHADEIAATWCAADPEAGRGRRAGVPEPARAPGEPVSDVAGLLRLVELGRAVAFVPASVARRHRRPEIAFRPVEGLTPLTLMVAWAEHSTSRAVAAFVRAATEAGEPAEAIALSPR